MNSPYPLLFQEGEIKKIPSLGTREGARMGGRVLHLKVHPSTMLRVTKIN
jgi:hypothetical protein